MSKKDEFKFKCPGCGIEFNWFKIDNGVKMCPACGYSFIDTSHDPNPNPNPYDPNKRFVRHHWIGNGTTTSRTNTLDSSTDTDNDGYNVIGSDLRITSKELPDDDVIGVLGDVDITTESA